MASTRVPMHAPGHPGATHVSHMGRGHPAPPHGIVYAAAEGKHRRWQSFTRANFTTRSCRALTRARTHSRQQGASQLRICEGYDPPTFTAIALNTKMSKQHAGREPSKRNQEHTPRQGTIGHATKSHQSKLQRPSHTRGTQEPRRPFTEP